MDSSKEGSIQKMIDSEISEIVNTSPSNLESLRNISEWFEEDETGAASLINAVNQSSQDVEKIKNSTVYLNLQQ